MENILVHVCCAPCATYCFEKLVNDGYKVTGYFYNPNIHPESEYNKRLDALVKFMNIKNYKLIIENESSDVWFDAVKGLEERTENGKRCEVCFRMRLEKTAFYAKEKKFDGFTTVLTVSPHKNSILINKTGKNIADKHGIDFIEENFKKKNGFKRSMELSDIYNLYRQNYCGCIYSLSAK